jgi:hypothetical protein
MSPSGSNFHFPLSESWRGIVWVIEWAECLPGVHRQQMNLSALSVSACSLQDLRPYA